MTSEEIGRVIRGRYRLISRLATGGMGVTYRAWDMRVGGPVVLKMPRRPKTDPDGSEFARLAARFAREVEVMRSLAHDHIVPIVDHGDDAETPFVAMRFLPGGSLSDHRKPAAAVTWQAMAAGAMHFWLPSMAEALDFMHSQGVVHRDVKPANIFFDGFWNAFLGDFGIAKVFGDDAAVERGQTLTATHLAIGTPEYMAPELLAPKATADGRADQYALAISLYELLSGHRPFTGTTAHIVVEHATLPAPPLDWRTLGLPQSLAAAVDRALAKKPDERFKSCMDFARTALADVTPQPNEPGVVRLLCPGCRRVLRVPHDAGGRRGNCPSCKEFVEIAEDFSALWLKSEAALVAEPPATPSTVPVLGVLDAEAASAGAQPAIHGSGEPPAPEFLPAPRGWTAWGVAVMALAAALLAGPLGGLVAHWGWSAHHGRVVQVAAAERARERAGQETAIQAAARVRLDAVAAVEDEWKRKLEDVEQSWAKRLSMAETMRQETEQRLMAVERDSKATIDRAARLEAERAAADRKAREIESRKAALPPPLSVVTNSVGIEMKLMPAGEFTMGDESDGPPHKVRLTKPYYIGVTEVTNAQWKRVMNRRSTGGDQADDCPVTGVSWDEAAAFCRKLSAFLDERAAGRVYRFPTEAEWEYACRAGATTAYSFGDDDDKLGDYAWFAGNSDGKVSAVGLKKPNGWGLYDMHGNVREWCRDWHGPYSDRAETDPLGPATGSLRVARSGICSGDAEDCRSADRLALSPSRGYEFVGFRLVWSPPGAKPSPDVTTTKDPGLGGGQPKPATLEAAAEPAPVNLPSLTNSVGIVMKLLPAGESIANEFSGLPVQMTPMEPFYMGVTEVTNAQWRKVMKTPPPSRNKADDCPVTDLSAVLRTAFCRTLSGLPEERAAGRQYRLPTEMEWQYACRAGTNTLFEFGDDAEKLGDYAWFKGNSGGEIHPVGRKKPNAWGLYDMLGNVGEWCRGGLALGGDCGNSLDDFLQARYQLLFFHGGGEGIRLVCFPSEAEPTPQSEP